MRYIKNYTDYILESKINYNWNDFFLSILDDITDKKSRAKLEQLLVRDIFSNANEFLYTDDIKTYSQLPSIKKFDMLMDIKYNSYMVEEYAEMLTSIKDALLGSNANISNYKTLYDLAIFADEWHENLDIVVKKSRSDETPNTDKFIVYPNGWYWINLNTDFSKDEKENMGHCGQDSGKILFSLRDDEKQSHITVSYNPNNKTVYQIKGRKNTKPKSIYHKYIIDMLLNDKHVINIIGTGWYKPELDFSLLDISEEDRNELLNKKPSFVYSSAMFEKYFNDDNLQMVISMCSNGYIYDGNNIKKYSTEEEVSGFIETVDKYKIKDKDILKNIITSCCQLSSTNMKEWSIDLLKYMKSCSVKCKDTTIILSYDELKKLMDNIEYIPSRYLLRNYIEMCDFKTLQYITHKHSKIKFDAAYLNALLHDIGEKNIRYDLLTDIFDFTSFEYKAIMCQTSDKKIDILEKISYIIAKNTKRKDIVFLTNSVINFINSIRIFTKTIRQCFNVYAKAFGFDTQTFEYILNEIKHNATPSDISNLSSLFTNANIIDLKHAIVMIEKTSYVDRGISIFNIFTDMDVDLEDFEKAMSVLKDRTVNIQFLDKALYYKIDYFFENMSDKLKNEILEYFKEDESLKQVYNNVYTKLNSI